MRKYRAEKRAEKRTYYEFISRNSKGEKIAFELTACESDCGKGTMPYLWKKHGFIDRVLKSWWAVTVYATDADGYCWGRYNPQEKDSEDGRRRVINFAWMLEATEENREKIIAEIERRAFA